jgi:hypothetical protein
VKVKEMELSHEMISLIKTFIQMWNKRVNLVQPITFLKEKP